MEFLSQPRDPFSRDVLEFPAIVELFQPFLSGAISLPALAQIEPRTDLEAIEQDLELAREARACLDLNIRLNLSGLADPRAVLEKLGVPGLLCSGLEIFGLIELAKTAGSARELFAQSLKLNELAQMMADFRGLLKELDGKILPDGSVDSSASPALARIRRSIERARQELQSTLEKVLRRLASEHVLQEEIVTVRNGRYVLPVQAGKRRTVEGLIHGASSSGASVYVEPLETLPLNNDLAALEGREEAEVRKILAEFSSLLAQHREDLAAATEILSRIDLAFAKAEFSRRHCAVIPMFAADRDLTLKNVRHPLLEEALRPEGREPVPLTIELREPKSLMVISGPNTGGKSVALKTIGAAAIMAQAGLPVGAEEVRLPVFRRVLADIGDQQSIAQSLSTFSAHIRNIQEMAATAGARDLVLLDELGGSTAPEEGAALAVAILEHFRRSGATVFASTHYSRPKAYAAETPEAVNAAMDFDEATLRPTYKLLAGLPGKSSALEIAERLGLDARIVHDARALLGPVETGASTLISLLHAKREEMESEQERRRERERDMQAREAERARDAAAERQAKLAELDRRLAETLREHDERWKSAIAEIRRKLDIETKPAKALATAPRQQERFAREAREEWNAQVLAVLQPPPAEESVSAAGATISPGDRVRLSGFSTPGVVTSILDSGELEVEIGRLRMRAPRNEVQLLATAGAAPRELGAQSGARRAAVFEPSSARSPEPEAEINVIGSTAEEARERVDKFLDEAYVAGRFRLRVVHGHGKGVLRKTLHQMFADHPHVEQYYPAPSNEGGAGATIVELRK
ncbi:MAG: endonuclease MutS2 [Terriglobia bacterium]